MQDFDIFHYRYGSFTERKNFHSFLILYTYSGSGTLSYRGRKYSLSEGDGFFINCMEYHLYQVEGQIWDTAILHMDGPLLPAFHELYMQHGSPLFQEPITGKYQQYLEQLLGLYSNPQLYRDWQVSTCIDNLLNHLLLLNSSHAAMRTEIPDNIRYLIKYMENNFDKPLTLDYLADFASITKYYLSREFKKYTGFAPNEYLISLRINRAKILLKNSTIPASKIAHEVGIHDMNNFTNLFKKKTGMTPIQYRDSNDIII
jgi:AraC-like DNA-binding protein